MVRPSAKVSDIAKDQMVGEVSDLSGVYMRSLVKKMSSSPSSKVRIPEAPNEFYPGHDQHSVGQGSCDVGPQNQQSSPNPPQQHKKKVRRRLHTSRPYQERLLNMAEARREIVTALKFHRASMKQQQQQQQELEQSPQLVQQPVPQVPFHTSPDFKTDMSPFSSCMIYQSNTGSSFTSPVDRFHQSPAFTFDSSNHMFSSGALFSSVPSCPNSSFSFPLPSQTLGLNLNFQDFTNLTTSPFQNNQSLFASPSSSTSSPAPSSTTTEEIHSAWEDSHIGSFFPSQHDNVAGIGGILSDPAIDNEVLREIKLMGDCHDMVWNDTMSLMKSAWWSKFSEATETSPEETRDVGEDDHLFTELTELPAWLNATDCYLQQNLSIPCAEDSSPDPALPCLGIGEIEGMDGDWLA